MDVAIEEGEAGENASPTREHDWRTEMHETDEMRDARYALQKLTTETPAAVNNMTRFMAALSRMLAGRTGKHMEEGEPIIQAGFRMTVGERNILMAAAARLNKDVVHLGLEADDGTGNPYALMIIRNEAEHITCYPRCALWSAPGSGRAVIIPIDDEPPCHFVFKRGSGLQKIAGWPASEIQAGLKRGQAALERMAASDALKGVEKEAFRHQVGWQGKFEVKSDRLLSVGK